MKNKVQHKDSTSLAFYSAFCKALNVKFDGVIGNNVSHQFPLHVHDSLCIGLVTKGQRNLSLSGNQITINANEIFVINQYEPHAIDQPDPHDYIAITIQGEGLDDVVFRNMIQSDRSIDLFLQLFYVLKEKEIDCLPEKWHGLYQHLIDTCQTLPENLSANENYIQKSIDYIHTNYQSQISVKDIAIQACMSTYHFCRLFKQQTGLSPHNYLRQYRLNRSYGCLQQKIPVLDTAIETGFYDSSHFIKTFQAFMAVSPGEYQESITK